MMNKRVKMGGACILALALTLAGLKLPSAYAALPVDLSQKGSIEFKLAKNVYPEPANPDEERADYNEELYKLPMTVKLYQVADITETGAYKAKDAYTTLGVDQVNSETKTEEWTAMAATAAELAAGTTEDYRAVKAKDSDSVKLELPMELGLYLVLVDDVVTDSYIYSFNPYLISVPNNYVYSTGSDAWVYNLTGDNAVGLKPERQERLGDLEIVKDLIGYNASLGGAYFVYEVSVPNPDGTTTSNVYKLSFTDTGSRSLTITDLPAGAEVTVTEVYTGASYSLTTDATQKPTITANPNSDWKVTGGDKPAELEPYTPSSVSFTNTYDKRQNGGSGVVNTFYKNGEIVDWRNDIDKVEVN